MNGKIIFMLFILYYHKEEVKAKKQIDVDPLFLEEELILFQNEPKYRHKREDVYVTAAEMGSGSPDFTTLFYNISTNTERPTTIRNEITTHDNDLTTQTYETTTKEPQTTNGYNNNAIIYGRNDRSLSHLFNENSYKSTTIYSPEMPINVLNEEFSSFRIHPNGFVSFGLENNDLSIQYPSSSISNFNFPIIAPFWTSSVFDSGSDLLFAKYNSTDMDSNLLGKVVQLIGSESTIARFISDSSSPSPDIIYSIIWKNIKTSSNSNQRASFQLLIVTSFSQSKSFAIFNYDFVNLNFQDQNVFIGFTDGNQLKFTNKYSNNNDAKNLPSLVDKENGNSGKKGVYVYNIAFKSLDSCTDWYYNKILTPNYSPLLISTESIVPCPISFLAASKNPFYALFTDSIWQSSDTNCFNLRTNSFHTRTLQQFCCYDQITQGLISSGKNAGFVYDSDELDDIIISGFKCCSDNNWSNCSKFYTIYPPTPLSVYEPSTKTITYGYSGGDPHFITFDNLTYTFNGLGKFILSKAFDKSFEVQASTVVLQNLNSSTISGTLFNSFAMKTNDSFLFQIRLNSVSAKSPALELFVNKSNSGFTDFVGDSAYFREFPCISNPALICTTIISNENGTEILFNNGLSLSLSIYTVSIDQYQSVSWISSYVSIIKNRLQYRNKLFGLMGNFNDDPSDDIESRSGQKPTDMSKERSIYQVLVTWALLDSEDDFFVIENENTGRSILRSATFEYQPTFLEDLNITDSFVNETCKGVVSCISDAILSGLIGVGVSTLNGLQNTQQAISQSRKIPPSIIFRNESIQIDWGQTNKPVLIYADIRDDVSFTIQVNASNALNYSFSVINNSSTQATVVITYFTTPNEYPSFQITVTDVANVTAIQILSKILICNCKSLSNENECIFDQTQLVVSSTTSFVACACKPSFYGDFCENLINYCEIANTCNLYPQFNPGFTCLSLSLAEQRATGLTFKCTGNCTSGFTADQYGACQDVNECENQTICPSNSDCRNKIGGYDCICLDGYQYKDGSCQEINRCNYPNNCEQKCTTNLNGYICSCYTGYQLVNSNSCTKIIDYPECTTLGCSQICTLESSAYVCKCKNGFSLSSDGKSCTDIDECAVNNGGCSHTCTNGLGTYACSCPIGFTLDTDYVTCKICPFNTYGVNCSQSCNCPNARACDNVLGCLCNIGYTGSDCSTKIDPCLNLTVPMNSFCQNQAGIAVFICLPGYQRNSSTDLNCYLVDNCQINKCPRTANCTNLVNSFNCTCGAGFSYNREKNTCDRINQCLATICPVNSVCFNLLSGSTCRCASGYIDANEGTPYYNRTSPNCVFINNCFYIPNLCTSNQICQNKTTTYDCVCREGFTLLNQSCFSNELLTSGLSTVATSTSTSAFPTSYISISSSTQGTTNINGNNEGSNTKLTDQPSITINPENTSQSIISTTTTNTYESSTRTLTTITSESLLSNDSRSTTFTSSNNPQSTDTSVSNEFSETVFTTSPSTSISYEQSTISKIEISTETYNTESSTNQQSTHTISTGSSAYSEQSTTSSDSSLPTKTFVTDSSPNYQSSTKVNSFESSTFSDLPNSSMSSFFESSSTASSGTDSTSSASIETSKISLSSTLPTESYYNTEASTSNAYLTGSVSVSSSESTSNTGFSSHTNSAGSSAYSEQSTTSSDSSLPTKTFVTDSSPNYQSSTKVNSFESSTFSDLPNSSMSSFFESSSTASSGTDSTSSASIETSKISLSSTLPTESYYNTEASTSNAYLTGSVSVSSSESTSNTGFSSHTNSAGSSAYSEQSTTSSDSSLPTKTFVTDSSPNYQSSTKVNSFESSSYSSSIKTDYKTSVSTVTFTPQTQQSRLLITSPGPTTDFSSSSLLVDSFLSTISSSFSSARPDKFPTDSTSQTSGVSITSFVSSQESFPPSSSPFTSYYSNSYSSENNTIVTSTLPLKTTQPLQTESFTQTSPLFKDITSFSTGKPVTTPQLTVISIDNLTSVGKTTVTFPLETNTSPSISSDRSSITNPSSSSESSIFYNSTIQFSRTSESYSTPRAILIVETTLKTDISTVNSDSQSKTSSSSSSLSSSSAPTTNKELITLQSLNPTSVASSSSVSSLATNFFTQFSSSTSPTITVKPTLLSTNLQTSSSSSTTTSTTTRTTTSSTSSTTSTTSATTTTTTTSTTTTVPLSNNAILHGLNDRSIIENFPNAYNSFLSYTIYSYDIPINILNDEHNFMRIHPNGFVSFGLAGATLSLRDPTSSISNFRFPIIAPFWSACYLDSSSNILYGRYYGKSMDNNLKRKVSDLINNSNQARATVNSAFVPEMIYSVIWKDLRPSRNSNERASFQVIIAISYSQQKSFTIFNYDYVRWTSISQNVFIGFTNGNNLKITNLFSNNQDSRNQPNLIARYPGNTNVRGVYVYDIGFKYIYDSCTNWYNSKILSPSYQPVNFFNKLVVECPLSAFAAYFNPFYKYYTNRLWLRSSCFVLRSNAFSDRYIQQVCCYDYFFGSLLIGGPNTGFVYETDNLNTIINTGFDCCGNGDAKNCNKFRQIYPSTVLTIRQIIQLIFAWGGGDPHLTTFDNLTYTFNGYGKYVFAKAKDNSFEVQASTNVIKNYNQTAATGSLFTSFAMRTNDSSIFQILLNGVESKYPYLELYVNRTKAPYEDFIGNTDYFKEFPCKSNPLLICTTVASDENGTQILFSNGLSLSFRISTVSINTYESLSWISTSVVLLNSIYNYTDSTEGLMGNNNGNPNDDIVSRSGQAPQDITKERSIFEVASTWELLSSEEDLFSASSSTRYLFSSENHLRVSGFTPTFFEDISSQLSPDVVNACGGSRACMSDAQITGLVSVGQITRNGLSANQLSVSQSNIVPPTIRQTTNPINIDWGQTSSPITIIASVTDNNDFNVSVRITTSSTNTNFRVIRVSATEATVEITYFPVINDYPSFEIIATDATSASSILSIGSIQICNCRSNLGNQCSYDRVQSVISQTISLVSCSCLSSYYGDFCDLSVDFCSLGNLCNPYPTYNPTFTCETRSVADQRATGLGYRCIGTCSSGFTTDEYGACRNINECDTPNVCPLNAQCVDQIGSFTCNCPTGYQYKNQACEVIDFCLTSLNNCDSICTPTTSGVTCSCYPGYDLVNNVCNLAQPLSSTCTNLGCEHFCIQSTSGYECKCKNGYELMPDGKSCQNINECDGRTSGCSDTCTDKTPGFECSCPIGKILGADKKTCQSCPSNTYGLNCAQTCNCPNAASCDSVIGCSTCNTGFTGANCDAVNDPCQNAALPANTQCVNQAGLAVFNCITGYQRNGTSSNDPCYKIDKCALNRCPTDSTCQSVSVDTCICQDGLNYNPSTNLCDDINECSTQNTCSSISNSVCVNTRGSYQCRCPNGFYDANLNTNKFDPKRPNCQDIDECTTSTFPVCGTNQKCTNTPGSFTCTCKDGFIPISLDGQCIQIFDEIITSSTAKPSTLDNTGLILVIVLPICGVLILIIVAGSVCYCRYKIRMKNSSSNKMQNIVDETSDDKEQEPHQVKASTSNQTGQSMFIKKRDLFEESNTNIDDDIYENDDFEDGQSTNDGSQNPSRSIYRTNYPFDAKPNKSEDEFFKSLEDNMRSSQKTTIVRPQSIFTDSSFSLPTAYYEQTTPYGDFISKKFRKYKIEDDNANTENNDDETTFDDDLKPNSTYDLDDDDDGMTFNAFENDDDMNDIIEAFNPNVRIPRPKLQINPFKVFKFGSKNSESNN